MLSAFLNPLTIAVGGLLVLTPIIIHLINRIRFRRVKWAAMEFLLKAQKRMRRRKILEQLILLFLRCLLVFLVGMLFARFVGCDPAGSGKETRPTTHVVVLDDTPSMADGWRREDGAPTDGFSEGTRLIHDKLMPAAAEAQTAQSLHVLRLSELDNPFPSGVKKVKQDGVEKDVERSMDEIRSAAKINAEGIAEMDAYLKSLRPSTVRKSLVDGLRKAKELLDKRAEANNTRVIHVVSDLRAADWAADGPAISDLLKELKEAGVAVHLIDVASPARKPDRKSPPFNDNVSIVEFKPRNRIVSVNQQAELEVRVKNFGGTDLKDVRIDFYLNGKPDFPFQSISIPTLPANQERTQTVQGALDQAGTKDNPLGRFNIITAVLATPEQGGLTIDNARHTIVEVRESIKVLFVDGRTIENGADLRLKPEGDSYYLRALFQTKTQELGNIQIEQAEAKTLDKVDLRPYTTVYLMNVPELSPAAVSNLERYVGAGGGVGVYLGKDVNPRAYNERCNRGGQGFFPVRLEDKPKEMTDEEKLTRSFAFAKRLMLREPGHKFHPALVRIYTNERRELLKDDGVERFFNLPNIDAHWPVSRIGQWRDDKSIQELYCLQNDAPIGSFEEKAENLVKEVHKRWNEPKFEKARKYLEPLLQKIRESTKVANPLSRLATLMDELLCDQINIGDESEPILREFWNQPEMSETRKKAVELRDEAKYGDPLYVVKQFGLGRVAVMTTDAGATYTGKKQWTDWPSLGGAAGWVVIAGEMQKYLAGGGDEANYAVGERFRAEFDFNRYEPTVQVSFLTTSDPSKVGNTRQLTLERKELGKLTMDAPANPPEAPADAPRRPFQLGYGDAKVPGAYLFTLTRKPNPDGPAGVVVTLPGGAPPPPDPLGTSSFVGVAYNVDALAEGDLRRANTDDIATQTNKAPLHAVDDKTWLDELKQKPTDLSSGRWLYLLILLVLLAEQAWAVRISYHTKPEDLETLAPSAAAAYAHHTLPTPAAAGEPAGNGGPTTSA